MTAYVVESTDTTGRTESVGTYEYIEDAMMAAEDELRAGATEAAVKEASER